MKSHHPSETISGATALVGILADPIAHIQTPQRLNAWFRDEGYDAVLVPMHVTANDLERLVEGARKIRNLGGLIVTVPHKEAMALLCDRLGEEAAMTGAVNAVQRMPDGRLLGENFDGKGFVGGLRSRGIDPKGHDVLLAGAGGAARAIGFALAREGIGSLVIANRNRDRAQELAVSIRKGFPLLPVATTRDETARPFSLIVNATTLGMKQSDEMPVAESLLRPGIVVAEAVMKPARTKLLAAAERHDCHVHEGRHMLESQIELLGRFVLGGRQS